MAWVLPGHDLAERFVDLLWEEAQVHATAKPVDRDDSVVAAEYADDKKDHVIFACWLFNEFYKQWQALSRAHDLEIEDHGR